MMAVGGVMLLNSVIFLATLLAMPISVVLDYQAYVVMVALLVPVGIMSFGFWYGFRSKPKGV